MAFPDNRYLMILPDKHPTVKGQDVNCLTCHVSDPPDESTPNPFSAYLHLTHQGS